ncbi:MAG: long-chain fatty acid--CoA ligase [Acidimicrobiales bacterium]
MQSFGLTLPMAFRRAEVNFANKTITTGSGAAGSGGQPLRQTLGQWADRSRRLAGALDTLAVSEDGRVGTFAWNSARHMEAYFAVPCSGRVLHTLNIRLFTEQLVYIVNHAEDEVVLVDRSLMGSFWPLIDSLKTVRHVVVMPDVDGPGAPELPDDPRLVDYEELLAGSEPAEFDITDEDRAAAMCYTSGTTGNPKGVVYSHRSSVLHAMGAMMADGLGVTEADVILPVVPMFHANAWGLVQAGIMAGSSFVLTGADMSPGAILDLIESERVTLAAGVPTIWSAVLDNLKGRDTSSLRSIVCGGSAVPKSLSEGFRARTGLPLLQAWGMTETHPIASVCRISSSRSGRSEEELADLRASQGLAVPGVELRITEPDTTNELAWDGEAAGELQARGAWVAAAYYNDPRSDDSFTDDGWLRTGDVATISPDGYIRLVDRTKDLVKSGGEWISSVELENEIMAHPAVAEAAVIGIPDDKWGERPLACVVMRSGQTVTAQEILDHLGARVAKWQVPDRVEFIDEVPKTSVGKFSKKDLRDRFGA